jgi:hypothetical protein
MVAVLSKVIIVEVQSKTISLKGKTHKSSSTPTNSTIITIILLITILTRVIITILTLKAITILKPITITTTPFNPLTLIIITPTYSPYSITTTTSSNNPPTHTTNPSKVIKVDNPYLDDNPLPY